MCKGVNERVHNAVQALNELKNYYDERDIPLELERSKLLIEKQLCALAEHCRNKGCHQACIAKECDTAA